VVPLMAHGCPHQAIVVASGYAARTVACWLARAGVQGQAVQEHLVAPPRDLGQVQADESRVKQQGGMVWMAWAMMISTRLWRAGEVREHRAMPLLRRLAAGLGVSHPASSRPTSRVSSATCSASRSGHMACISTIDVSLVSPTFGLWVCPC